MKARVKATGETVEVAYLSEDKYGNKYYNVTTDTRTYRETELEMMSDKGDYFYTYGYWEKLKHQYAGMAMQGIVSNEKMQYDLFKAFGKDESLDITISDFAIDIANTLVNKLKSKSNG